MAKFIENLEGSFLQSVLADPIDKGSLQLVGDTLRSPYGRVYSVQDGICDMRVLDKCITKDQNVWKEGQDAYEREAGSLRTKDEPLEVYTIGRSNIAEVYAAMPLSGSVLDVGGNIGTLRAFLPQDVSYICCDPFKEAFDNLHKRTSLLEAYPELLKPVSFVCCDAELLPFRSSVFDVVHMRSVIDHFFNPELAINESYRVLKIGGSLIVGLYVHGGKEGRESMLDRVKEGVRNFLGFMGIERFVDHHVWHPTFKELTSLITGSGFVIDKVHWQRSENDSVCYIKGIKIGNHKRLS